MTGQQTVPGVPGVLCYKNSKEAWERRTLIFYFTVINAVKFMKA
jgi:hypothetical protein